MSTPSTRARNARSARLEARTPSADADHALANIRAWTDLLVARGNRLLELAVRERESLAGIPLSASTRHRREAAVAASRLSGQSERAGKDARSRAKPLA